MIRVLQVFGCMDRGGAEAMIMELYRHIDRKKLQFDFVVHTERKCAFDDEIESLGGRIFRVPHFSGLQILEYRKSWKKLLSDHPEWQIVHGHMRSTAAIYLSEAKKQGRYTIAHSHNTSSGKGLQNIVKNALQKGIKKNADYYMACSEAAGKWLFGEEITKGKNYTILKNAIDTSKFEYDENIRKKVRNNLKIEDRIVLGHIGSFLSEQKNQSFLLQIYKEVKAIEPNSILVMVGDGPLRKNIEKQAEELGLSNDVIFTGVRSDVNELIQAMDVFVFPSFFEGLPVTLVEVQTSGLPCVISDRVPVETIITKDLVTVKSLETSSKEWAKHIISRLNEPRLSRIEEVKEHGYDIVETAKWLDSFYIQHMSKSI